MHFEFATSSRILFGPGKRKELPSVVDGFGKKALLMLGKTGRFGDEATELLARNGIAAHALRVPGEPDLTLVEGMLAQATDYGPDFLVAIGGGSTLDAAKAVAALLANSGGALEYLEVIGKGKPLAKGSLPMIAIPTTAGPGTEVTRNAVLISRAHGIKASLRGAGMLPRIAIVDPELTFELPPALTAATGMDALTQLIEAFVCARANPLIDAICRQGIRLAAQHLLTAFREGTNASAREGMCLASLFSGLALANAGLGAVHGFAAVLGGMYEAPHGAICAALLEPVCEINFRALRNRCATHGSIKKYEELGELFTGNTNGRFADALEWMARARQTMQIPTLSFWGVKQSDFAVIQEKAARSSSMKANPISLEASELEEILARAAGH